MNRLLNINFSENQSGLALLILRIGIAGMMLVHGLPKMLMLFGGEVSQFPGILGMSSAISLSLAVFAEVICSIFILLGLGTRIATIPLIITMLIAVFYIHAADPFANQELGLHYLLAYVILLILGSGKYSIDASLAKHKKVRFENA